MSQNTDRIEMQIDKSLLQHIRQGFNYGCEAIHGMEPLVPFGIIWLDDGNQAIERCRYGTYEDSVEHVMRAVSQGVDGATGYVIVWEGFIRIDDERKVEAIIAEASHKGLGEAIQVAHPYRLNEEGVAELVDDMLLLGQTTSLFDTADIEPYFAKHLIRPSFSTSDNVCSQPFAQMVVAAICVAANQFEGEEQERIDLGIRQLQQLEQNAESKMSRRIFSILLSEIAEGDLMAVLPTDEIEGLVQLMVNGIEQLNIAAQKGLLLPQEVDEYLVHVKEIMFAVLSRNGANAVSDQGELLLGLLDRVMAKQAA